MAGVAGAYLWIVADPFELDATRTVAPALPEEPLPVPAACEIRLARARTLFQQGRLREAAAQLAAGDPDERHRASMDELLAAIQRQLLATPAARKDSGQATPPLRPSAGSSRQ
jgi:hypothetical protein